MTHEEARSELSKLAWRLRHTALDLESWADEVGRIIAEAYPGATSPPLEPNGAHREPSTPTRMNTWRDSRYRVTWSNPTGDPAHADVPGGS